MNLLAKGQHDAYVMPNHHTVRQYSAGFCVKGLLVRYMRFNSKVKCVVDVATLYIKWIAHNCFGISVTGYTYYPELYIIIHHNE